MLSIVVPTYNEAKNISEFLERLQNSVKEFHEIIVVNDNSPDGTGKIVNALCEHYPLKVIHRKKKSGLASAILEGLRHSSGDLLCILDADLSHPPELIPRLIYSLRTQNADIVIASRFAPNGSIENWPIERKLNSRIAILSTTFLTNVKDPMSGFFIMKKEVIRNAPLAPRGFKLLLEILVKGQYQTISEIPFTFKDRTQGQSKLNFQTYLEFIIQLLDLYSYTICRRSIFTKHASNK